LNDPREFFFSAPAAEQRDAWAAQTQAYMLRSHLTTIAHALGLLDFADQQIQAAIRAQALPHAMFSSWKIFGGTTIIIAVEDFYRSLTAMRSLLQRCKTLWQRVDHERLEEARRQFEQLYPQHLDLRNAACHQVDYSAKPHNQEKNSVAGPVEVGSGFVATGEGANMYTANMSDRTIFYSGEGSLLKIDLTTAIVGNLERISASALSSLGTRKTDQSLGE
jgi:hypothetical protein